MGSVKVSVVVAAGAADRESFAAFLAALERQTLDPAAFEIVWVDEGPAEAVEPDSASSETDPLAPFGVERLDGPAPEGQRRNAGLRVARGDYVILAEPADRLFPEALRRMSSFADDNHLDVVLPKQIVGGASRPDHACWRHPSGVVTELDRSSLRSASAHLFLRRSYLAAHDIWFPGPGSGLDELAFNLKALSGTDRIGALADYPCYAATGERPLRPRGSQADWRECERAAQELRGATTDRRDQLLACWYAGSVLRLAGQLPAASSADHPASARAGLARVLPYFPPELDQFLTPSDRARSALLRAGDYDAFVALSRADAQLRTRTDRSATEWHDGRLRISISGVLTENGSTPMRFRRDGDAVVRVMPDGADGAGVIDVRADLSHAIGELIIRARSTHVDWILPSTSSLEAVPAATDGSSSDELNVRFELEGWLDPLTVAGGRRMDVDVWDVFHRIDGLGWARAWWVPIEPIDTPVALVDGVGVVLYPTRNNNLAIDTADKVRTVIGSAVARLTNARLESAPDGSIVTRVELPAVHASGATDWPGTAVIDGREIPAQLVGDGGTAALVVHTAHLMSANSLRGRFGGRTSARLLGFEFAGLAALRELTDGVAPADIHERLPFLPATIDGFLTAADRLRVAYARAGEFDALAVMNRVDAGLRLTPLESTATWHDGRLRVTVSGRLNRRDATAARFRRHADAIVRVLPAKAQGNGVAELDIGPAVAAAAGEIFMRLRSTGTVRTLSSTSTIRFEPASDPDELHLHFAIEGWLDPKAAAEGVGFDSDIWDFSYRFDGLGWGDTTPVPASELAEPTALIDGLAMVLYSTRDNNLAIDAGDRVRTLVGTAVPRLANATIEPDEDGMRITYISLPGTHAVGETELHGEVAIDERVVPARLVGSHGSATLVVETASLPRARTVRATFGGRASAPLFADELAAARKADRNRGLVKPIYWKSRRLARKVTRRIKTRSAGRW